MSARRSLLSLSLLADHYPALHGLRVLAIVSVLQVHVTVVLKHSSLLALPWLEDLSTGVWFGMDLFFLLSGFLIGSMLMNDGPSGGTPSGIGRFYARRAFRIVPLYYVVLTAVFLTDPRALKLSEVWPEYLYVANYLSQVERCAMGWGWSLSVEEHFYLAVPLLLLLLRKLPPHGARVTALLALWALAFVSRWATWRFEPTVWTPHMMMVHLYIRTHTRLDPLVAGVLLAYLQRNFRPQLRALFSKWPARLAAYALSGAALAAIYKVHGWFGYDTACLLRWGTLTSLMYVALCLPLINHEGALSRALSLKPFRYAATLGYGVYLVHVPICVAVVIPAVRWMWRAHWSQTAIWSAAVALLFAASLLVAYVLHLVVEKPALWLRDRWTMPRPKQTS